MKTVFLHFFSFLSERQWRHRDLTYPAKHLCHIINLSQSLFCCTKDTSSSVMISVFLLYAGRGCTETVLRGTLGCPCQLGDTDAFFMPPVYFCISLKLILKYFSLFLFISLCSRQQMGFCLGTKYTFCQNGSSFIAPWMLEI